MKPETLLEMQIPVVPLPSASFFFYIHSQTSSTASVCRFRELQLLLVAFESVIRPSEPHTVLKYCLARARFVDRENRLYSLQQ